jgi:hypothetical protein
LIVLSPACQSKDKVLVHKYGERGGEIKSSGTKAWAWWKDIVNIKKEFFNGLDNWFEHFLFRKLDNGE